MVSESLSFSQCLLSLSLVFSGTPTAPRRTPVDWGPDTGQVPRLHRQDLIAKSVFESDSVGIKNLDFIGRTILITTMIYHQPRNLLDNVTIDS